MSAFDYAETKADADELIAEFGQSGYVRRPTSSGPAHNPTAGAPANHAATFAVIDYSAREVDGSRILATDKRALLAVGSLTITPATTDLLVEADAQVYKIVRVGTIKPAGTVVLYDLQVRR